MGFRFRKTIKLGPVNVNLSKSGVGYSVGGKGLRVIKKADGGTRTTVSIPGTGISHVTETSAKAKASGADKTAGGGKASSQNPKKKGGGGKLFIGTIVVLFLIVGVSSSCRDREADDSQDQQAVEDTIQEDQQAVQEPAEDQET